MQSSHGSEQSELVRQIVEISELLGEGEETALTIALKLRRPVEALFSKASRGGSALVLPLISAEYLEELNLLLKVINAFAQSSKVFLQEIDRKPFSKEVFAKLVPLLGEDVTDIEKDLRLAICAVSAFLPQPDFKNSLTDILSLSHGSHHVLATFKFHLIRQLSSLRRTTPTR